MKPQRMCTIRKILFVILAGLIHLQIVQAGQKGKSPVKVFILAGRLARFFCAQCQNNPKKFRFIRPKCVFKLLY
jgi:hypothetical protein